MKSLQKLSIINFQKIINANRLTSIIIRTNSSSIENLSDDEKEIKEAFDPIMQKLEDHPAKKPLFFTYLEKMSKTGFTPLQYTILRDNIFARTQLTIPSIAQAIYFAAMNDDFKSVANSGKNLWDEVGYGDSNKVHGQLLLNAFGSSDTVIFGLPSFTKLSDSTNSPHLTQELLDYRKMKMESFTGSYPYIAGNLLAHEHYADDWLDNIKKYVFESYKEHYKDNQEDYEKAMEFFKAHKDDEKKGGNVEEQHGIMAQETAIYSCKKDIKKLKEVEQGAIDFANAQAKLWNSLMREMEKAGGIPIKPQRDKANNPNTTIKNATSKIEVVNNQKS